MKPIPYRRGFVGAALWAALLYLPCFVAALTFVPSSGHSEDSRQALVVYLVSDDDRAMRGWALATNMSAPEGSMDGPMNAASCVIVGAMRIANWAEDNWRGFSVREMRCISVASVDAFFRAHGSLAKEIEKAKP